MKSFVELLVWLGADRGQASTYYDTEIVPRYSEKGRFYHTLDHIHACFIVWDEKPVLGVSNIGFKRNAVELALWFHDLVYAPQNSGNEEASAELLEKCGASLGLQANVVQFAAKAILWTKHGKQPDWQSTISRAVVDVDLSILGASPKVFDQYEKEVREEYAHVPDSLWIPGRTAVLEHFRKRDRIYMTAEYIACFEEPARQNIKRSLLRLERGEVLRLTQEPRSL
jgi:predicted metal-dependent HD superfamily phosphohydrolase